MAKKGFIFDLDGVIVDTAKYHYLAWKELADHLGFEFTQEDNERLKGVSRERSLEILLQIGQVELPEIDKKKLLIDKNEQYLKYISKMDQSEILPGIEVALHFLKSHQIPFSLGSASKNARLILESLNLLSLFDAIIDGNDVTTAKPDPEVFNLAAEKINLNPLDCIVVEDAKAGVEAAKAAGMVCVGIGNKKVLGQADYVLSGTNELTVDFLKKLIG